MPRNASGTFSLVSGNPVVSGTLIDATWANNTLNDIANEMTDSLSRSGEGGMLAPLRLTDGVQATPGLGFTNEPGSGLYRAGTNEWWSVAGGVQVQQHTATGALTRFAAGAVGTPSLSAFGDVNTGLFFPAADTIAASVGGVEGWRLTSTGNLGIGGTLGTTPSLNRGVYLQSNTNNDVIGFSLRVEDGGNNRRGSMFLDDSAGLWGWDVTASSGVPSYVWRSASVEQMRLNDSGNLGIGTSSPAFRLDVLTGVEGDSIRLNNNNANIGAANTFGFVVAEAGSARVNLRYRRDGSGSAELYNVSNGPFVFGTNNTERARIDSSGNLGIGTTSPLDKLHVAGAMRQVFPSGFAGSGIVGAIDGVSNGFRVTNTVGNALTFTMQNGSNDTGFELDNSRNAAIGAGSVATSATDGFLYVPTCAGTPTGTPTAKSGYAPIVVNTTNNKLYFYSTGVWRDAGP